MKKLIDWCPIVNLSEIGSANRSSREIEAKCSRWAELMVDSTFFKVSIELKKRPLLFIYYRQEEMEKYHGEIGALKSNLGMLRRMCSNLSVNDPYIVIFDPMLRKSLVNAIGADAVSNYISDFRKIEHGNFAQLNEQVVNYWVKMQKSGAQFIPISQMGWDTRPRKRGLAPWESDKPKSANEANYYYDIATPEEFAHQIKQAINFIKEYSSLCPSKTILAYSWNECDEGGCMLPTIGDKGGSYLKEISKLKNL